ncbi:MAG TPA: hypothetical protein VHC50_10230 [Puia sp.]|jgi:hypothetical protein|nr:hypothetical protein [Puia sp.]
MNLEKYPYVSKSDHQAFFFKSSGPKGIIKKGVLFRRISERNDNIYNISFGDWNEVRSRINDRVISNNGDREKVLATVALIILEFSAYFPHRLIYMEGSTASRTRLYQMGINKHYAEISNIFDVIGCRNGTWEIFKWNRNYEAFVMIRK